MPLFPAPCPTVQLSNGLEIPILGLGTSHNGGYSHDAILFSLKECGIRHLDTATRYGCEEKLGQAVRASGLPRSELWLTNKLWPGDYGYRAAQKACLDSCTAMMVEYFDLYLMHWPGSLKPGCSNRELRAETWRALEDLYKKGKGNQSKCKNDIPGAACCRNSAHIFFIFAPSKDVWNIVGLRRVQLECN